ncbi:MAG UNVERIFIED_CONTAM: hypothetical protein LVR29_23485 [Microcystis novacekii LVE1205-3]
MVLYPLRMQCRAFPNDNTLRRSSGQASALLSTSIRKASFLIFIAAGGIARHQRLDFARR